MCITEVRDNVLACATVAEVGGNVQACATVTEVGSNMQAKQSLCKIFGPIIHYAFCVCVFMF